MKKSALVILAPEFEEMEAVTPVDMLRRAGVEVTIAALDAIHVVGRSGIVMHAEVLLEAVLGKEFDMLILPGGPGVKVLRKGERVIGLVREFHEKGKWIGAICAAPVVLRDAGILEGKLFTAHSSMKGELSEMTGGTVEVDGNIVTARGAGTAVRFSLKLIEALFDKRSANQVKEAIEV